MNHDQEPQPSDASDATGADAAPGQPAAAGPTTTGSRPIARGGAQSPSPTAGQRAAVAIARLDRVSIALIVGLLASAAVAPLQFGTLFDLPAHVLFVHFPVVVIPLLALATIAMIWHRRWRERYSTVLAFVGIAATAATTLAAEAGEALEDRLGGGDAVRETIGNLPPRTAARGETTLERHADAGGTLKLIVLAFAISLVVVAVHERLRARATTSARDAGAGTPTAAPGEPSATAAGATDGAEPTLVEGTTTMVLSTNEDIAGPPDPGPAAAPAAAAATTAARAIDRGWLVRGPFRVASAAVVTLLAIVSLGMTVYTGHLGSRAAWEDRLRPDGTLPAGSPAPSSNRCRPPYGSTCGPQAQYGYGYGYGDEEGAPGSSMPYRQFRHQVPGGASELPATPRTATPSTSIAPGA